MNQKNYCWICDQKASKKMVSLRSKKNAELNSCFECDFHFFTTENIHLLENDKLDVTRLESAGLARPELTTDFENGYRQSKIYIADYLSEADKGSNILEIGCSWGYFLKAANDNGVKAIGVEINDIRRNFVNQKLELRCVKVLEDLPEHMLFKKIFLFYSLEYIVSPLKLLIKLVDLLEPNGEIILITPNVNDALRRHWNNERFNSFFFDECSVGYYSKKAIENLMAKVSLEKKIRFNVVTKQGYSIFNHLHWYFNGNPVSNNKMVGGDLIVEDLKNQFVPSEITACLQSFIHKVDKDYKAILEKNDLGNQIILKMTL